MPLLSTTNDTGILKPLKKHCNNGSQLAKNEKVGA